MKRILKWLLSVALILAPMVGIGQNTSFWTDRAVGSFPVLPSGQTVLIPIQYGQVRICNFPATGSPCTNPANGNVFDLSGNPLIIQGGNFGQIQTDVVGRFSFECNPGQYQLQVAATGSNTPQLNYPIACAMTTLNGLNILGGNNVFTGINTFSGSIVASVVNSQVAACNQTGADLGAKINTSLGLLPVGGGTVLVDRSCIASTWSTTVTISVNGTHLVLDSGGPTFSGSTQAITISSAVRGVLIEGTGNRADQAGGGPFGTTLNLSNTAASGIVAANAPGLIVRQLNIAGPGSGTGVGLNVAGHALRIDNVQVSAMGGDGVDINGSSANSINSIIAGGGSVSNGGNGYNLISQLANEVVFIAANTQNNTLDNFHIGSSVNVFLGTQANNPGSGKVNYHFLNGSLANTGWIYAEPLGDSAITFDTGANYNDLALLNGTSVTDNGTENHYHFLADNPSVGTQQNQVNKVLLTTTGALSFNNDTGISRLGAGVLCVDATPLGCNGIITMAAIRLNNIAPSGHVPYGNGSNYVDGGPVPKMFGCGTTTTCSNTDGGGTSRIVYGSCTFSASTTCTVTGITAFTSTSSYFCQVTEASNTGVTFKVANVSTSSFTITASASNSDTVNYTCPGN